MSKNLQCRRDMKQDRRKNLKWNTSAPQKIEEEKVSVKNFQFMT